MALSKFIDNNGLEEKQEVASGDQRCAGRGSDSFYNRSAVSKLSLFITKQSEKVIIL